MVTLAASGARWIHAAEAAINYGSELGSVYPIRARNLTEM